MRLEIDAIGLTAVILVSLAYVLFGCVFLFRKRPPKAEEAKRAPAATLGIVLQGVSFFLLWSAPRQQWWPFPPSRAGEVALAAAAIVLAYASCWLSIRAVRTLGKQWTYNARLVKGHELITQGPYGVVRNPIYLGMFGLILSTCLAFSCWWSGLAAVVLFLIGNRIRIRTEEQLLRESFAISSRSTPGASRRSSHDPGADPNQDRPLHRGQLLESPQIGDGRFRR